MSDFDEKLEGLEKEPIELYRESKNRNQSIWTKSFLDCLFHTDTNKLFDFGEKQVFGFNHLFGVDESILHGSCYPRFRQIVTEGLQKGKKLTKLVFSTFWKESALEIFWMAFYFWSQIPTPYLTKWLLEWLETDTEEGDVRGYYYAFWICVCNFLLPVSEGSLDNALYKISLSLDLNLKVGKKVIFYQLSTQSKTRERAFFLSISNFFHNFQFIQNFSEFLFFS